MTTLDAIRAAARLLTAPEKAQLISDLAQELVAPPATPAVPGDPQALVATVQQVGPWEGADLTALLELTYATRSPAEGYV